MSGGLLFGLGDADSISEIRVRWPGGADESFVSPSVDRDLLIVEGSEMALMIAKE